MPTFRLNKLVRDKIPELNRERGIVVTARTLDEDEYKTELIKKFKEELSELANAGDANEFAKELADIQTILDSLCIVAKVSKDELHDLQQRISNKAGSFNDRQYIETLLIPEGDEWVAYYRKDPKRFPEII